LQAILVAAAAPAIVNASNLMPVFARKEVGGLLMPIDFVRETFENDIATDSVIVRHDILFGYTQLCVDQRYASIEQAKAANAKQTAIDLFDNELRHSGHSWADVKPLPWHRA
jgi:hypothetical protein